MLDEASNLSPNNLALPCCPMGTFGGLPEYKEAGSFHVHLSALVPKSDVEAVPPPKKKSLYAVPLEMRSSFLVQMLRDCFVVPDWLGTICKISGEAALLVTDTVPQTPYFWAIHLTEESHRNMQRLFSILAEVESQMPFLPKQEVQRGTRCMAECIVGEEGTAWNRWQRIWGHVLTHMRHALGPCCCPPNARTITKPELCKKGKLGLL
ncbi:tudor domain-containing protein 10-like [Sphaerodactylus townsendi]|uniref:tudor domain-containing protein 10-like n=1 Tax=Sphaerodactylus townsendi TaxID=933632 RepID=UPI00202761C5|nr:tudor domain-containing protein 10-like [Sphaerodactylus townsendi]